MPPSAVQNEKDREPSPAEQSGEPAPTQPTAPEQRGITAEQRARLKTELERALLKAHLLDKMEPGEYRDRIIRLVETRKNPYSVLTKSWAKSVTSAERKATITKSLGEEKKPTMLPQDRPKPAEPVDATPQLRPVEQPGTTARRDGGSPAANQPGDGFPTAMAEEAFHGIAGQVCAILEEQNETCREALLAQVIVGFGNLVGQGPRTVEANFLNEFVLIVGETSTARKGTSLRYALDHLRRIDPDWERAVRACPPSGEGIVWHLRDARELKNGKVDPGISEKRSFFRAEEFSRIMASIAGGGTLSQRLRECWDHHNPLENLTKIDPIRASDTHISLVAHCTPFEFAQCVRTAEQRNGFINRFLIIAARGVKAVPRPKPIDWTAHPEIVGKLREIVNKFQKTTKIGFTNRAAAAWDQWYVGYRQ